MAIARVCVVACEATETRDPLTRSTVSMSRPRAATSVATRSLYRPACVCRTSNQVIFHLNTTTPMSAQTYTENAVGHFLAATRVSRPVQSFVPAVPLASLYTPFHKLYYGAVLPKPKETAFYELAPATTEKRIFLKNTLYRGRTPETPCARCAPVERERARDIPKGLLADSRLGQLVCDAD